MCICLLNKAGTWIISYWSQGQGCRSFVAISYFCISQENEGFNINNITKLLSLVLHTFRMSPSEIFISSWIACIKNKIKLRELKSKCNLLIWAAELLKPPVLIFNLFQNRPSIHTLLSQFTFSSLQIMFSLFSSVSVDRGLKRNLEQREVKGSIILWKRKKNGIIGWEF